LAGRYAILFLTAVPFVFAATLAHADDLKLEDVVSAAMTQSTAVKRADAKTKQAEGQLQQAEGAFDWTVSGKTGWQRLYLPKVRNGLFTNETEVTSAISVDAGVSKKFENGITIQPGFTFYANTAASDAQTFGLTKPRPHFNVNVPLWQNSGSDSPLAAKAHAAAKALQGSRFENDYARGLAVHDAVQVYWRCLALREQTRIAKQAEDESLDYDALLKRQTEQGQLEPAELDRATADQAVKHVEVTKSQVAEQSCGRQLRQVMGSPVGTTTPPSVTGAFPDMNAMSDDVTHLNEAAMTDLALRNRLDLQALAQYAGAATDQVKGAHSAEGPQVDLSLDTDGVFVNLSKSIEGNLEDGTVAAAQAQETIARLNLKDAEEQVRRDVADQVQAMKAALTDWKNLSHSADLMEGVVASARKRAAAGFLPRSAQSDAEADLAQTRQAVVDAQLRFCAALTALRLSTGTIAAQPGAPAGALAQLFRTLPQPGPAPVGAAPDHPAGD
jgi:outer membrane protein TolC